MEFFNSHYWFFNYSVKFQIEVVQFVRELQGTFTQFRLVELEQQNPPEEPVHQQGQVSTTDPESWIQCSGAP